MNEKTFQYSWSYKLDFVPGIIFISFLIVLAATARSKPGTEIYGYLIFAAILILFVYLVIQERLKVARKIIVRGDGLYANSNLIKDDFIAWNDVASLEFDGYSWWFMSGKIKHTNIYASVISKDTKRIVIRKEIVGYDELISIIETRTGKKFIKSAKEVTL